MALRSRIGSSGLISQPSASTRRARNTSARRSSSTSTGMWSSRPAPSSRRRSMHTAMAPMLPIWRSRMTRSGLSASTAGNTNPPAVTIRTVSVGPLSTERTSSTTHGASAATITSGIPAQATRPHRYHPRERLPGGPVLDIQVDLDANITVCRPVGELDAFTVSQFRQSLAELASSPSLLIDLSGVPFVDSAGLGALIGGIRRVRELGGDVAVACNRPTLTRLLRTTGFDRIVTVAETIEEAEAALGTRPA